MGTAKVGGCTPCNGCGHSGTGAYVQRGPVWICSKCDDELESLFLLRGIRLGLEAAAKKCEQARRRIAVGGEEWERSVVQREADAIKTAERGILALSPEEIAKEPQS